MKHGASCNGFKSHRHRHLRKTPVPFVYKGTGVFCFAQGWLIGKELAKLNFCAPASQQL